MLAEPSWSSPPPWARAPRVRPLIPGPRRFGPGLAVSSSSAPLRLPRHHSVRTLAFAPRRTIATTTALPAPIFRCARTAPTAWTTARACRQRCPLRRRGPPLVLAARAPCTRMASWAPTTAQANRCHRRRPAQPPCVPALASARRLASTPPTPIATTGAASAPSAFSAPKAMTTVRPGWRPGWRRPPSGGQSPGSFPCASLCMAGSRLAKLCLMHQTTAC
jgi:hypothetical protein